MQDKLSIFNKRTLLILLAFFFWQNQGLAQNQTNEYFGVSVLGSGFITGYYGIDNVRYSVGVLPFGQLAVGASIDILNYFPTEGENAVTPYWGYGITGGFTRVSVGLGASILIGLDIPVGDSVDMFMEVGGGFGFGEGEPSNWLYDVPSNGTTPVLRFALGSKF